MKQLRLHNRVTRMPLLEDVENPRPCSLFAFDAMVVKSA